jgi:hypothetical protein
LLRARVFAPLGRAAASRPEGGERSHYGGDISSAGRNVKGASAYIKIPFSFPNSDFAAQSELRSFVHVSFL